MWHKWQETQFESKILEDMAQGGMWQQENLRASGTWGWEGLAHVVTGRGGFFNGHLFKMQLREEEGRRAGSEVCVCDSV